MSMESSIFWGNTSHWGVTEDGVLLVVSMVSYAGQVLLYLDAYICQKMGCMVRRGCGNTMKVLTVS